MVRARVTSKGQITIPVEIRRQHDIDVGDVVEFVSSPTEIRLIKAGSVIRETAGIFKSEGALEGLTTREMKDMAEAAWVEDVMERMERAGEPE